MKDGELTAELEFEVRTAWELRICTCCSNSYLLLLTNGQYLYLDTWALTPFAEAETFPKRNLRLAVDPQKKVVLSVRMDGTSVPKGPELLDPIAESEFAGSEYFVLKENQLPIVWRQSLNAQ